MLEQLRRQSRSFIIWLLFAIIILAFVFTFGSQGGLDLNCNAGGGSAVMTVKGEPVSVHSLRWGMNFIRGQNDAKSKAQMVLDQLVVREILAQAAEEAGFVVTDEMVANAIGDRGKFWILGAEQDGKGVYFDDYQGGKVFDPERLERVVQSWNLPSTDLFIEEQRREMLANLMREQLASLDPASVEEARTRFRYNKDQVTVDAVQFRPAEYRRKMVLSKADVDRYLGEHGDEVTKKYEADERLYKGRSPEVHLRQIVFKRAKPAGTKPDPAPGADGADGAGSGDTAAATPDPARAKADAAHARLTGGADFAAVAREVSEDDRSRDKGGDLGWRNQERPGLGAKDLGDALKDLEVGAISAVLETPISYVILKVEGKREGDLSYDQVKHEIAERMALEHYSKEAARRAAEAALAVAKSGKKLEEIFELDSRPSQPGQGLDPDNPPEGMTKEQWQQLLQQLERSVPQPMDDESGSLVYESRDVPAESMLQPADGADDDPPAPPPADDGADEQPAAAQPIPAADTGPIPAVEGVAPPKVKRLGPMPRDPDGNLPGLGKSEALVELLFEKLDKGELGPEVYEVDGSYVIVQLHDRERPDMKEFDDAEKIDLQVAIGRQRAYANATAWVRDSCKALDEAGDIFMDAVLLGQLFGENGEPMTFRACTTLQ